MLERLAGHVLTFLADISDDHADIGNRHRRHFDDLDRHEARIEEVAPGQQHLFLQPLETAVTNEQVRVLEHVVAGNLAAGDLAGRQRLAFLGRDDADLVLRDIDRRFETDLEQDRVDPVVARRNDLRLRTALTATVEKRLGILIGIAVHALGDDPTDRQGVAVTCLDDTDLPLRDIGSIEQLYREEQRIDPERSRRNHAHLRAALATALEKRPRILEEIAFDVARDDPSARQRGAVAGLHDTDAALRNDHELDQFDRVLPRPQTDVQTR